MGRRLGIKLVKKKFRDGLNDVVAGPSGRSLRIRQVSG